MHLKMAFISWLGWPGYVKRAQFSVLDVLHLRCTAARQKRQAFSLEINRYRKRQYRKSVESRVMTISTGTLFKGTIWTIGAYGMGTALRTATNIVLARLLAPDIFGTMLTVYTLRMGIELISDVGINQNIVYNENADNPEF
jgi:hypothetical protein